MDSIKYNALIVDDSDPARKKIRRYLEDHPSIQVLGEARNGMEAVELVIDRGSNLLFLDIQMPFLNGFEVLEYLQEKEIDPWVIFVTAHDRFAVKAFDLNAVDYLLKPVDKSRFDQAIAKLQSIARPSHGELIKYYRQENPQMQRIPIKVGNRLKLIPVHQIDLMITEHGLVTLYGETDSHLTDYTLDYLEKVLPTTAFFRNHRSMLCRLSKINEIISEGDRRYSVSFDHIEFSKLPLSRRRYSKLKSLLSAV